MYGLDAIGLFGFLCQLWLTSLFFHIFFHYISLKTQWKQFEINKLKIMRWILKLQKTFHLYKHLLFGYLDNFRSGFSAHFSTSSEESLTWAPDQSRPVGFWLLFLSISKDYTWSSPRKPFDSWWWWRYKNKQWESCICYSGTNTFDGGMIKTSAPTGNCLCNIQNCCLL